MFRISFISVPLLLVACAPYPLHAIMTDAQIDETLNSNFHPGMSRDDVDSTLSGLRISRKWRLWYDDPPRMIARLWEPGGFWIDNDDDTVEWVDVLYEFDSSLALTGWKTQRDQMRYVGGRPYYWKYDSPMRDYPFPPPPPKEWQVPSSIPDPASSPSN